MNNNSASNIFLAKHIKTDHNDLIQDISYDFFGKRVATASLDQLVKIWNVKENNDWELKDDIKVNPGLYKVAWAHPEFGQQIAVAYDRTVCIFEELCHNSKGVQQPGWTKRVPSFTDSRSTITDIKFAPKQLGLQLIATTASGEARIYECNDSIPNGSTWSLQQEIKTNMDSCSSCSWSTCLTLPVLLAFGCDSTHTVNKLAIFEYNENTSNQLRTYSKLDFSTIFHEPIRSIAFAPSIGKIFHIVAIASKILIVLKIAKNNNRYEMSPCSIDKTNNDIPTWRVCWNTIGSVLATAGDDRNVRLWKSNYQEKWNCFAEIIGDTCQVRVDTVLQEHQNRNQRQHQQQQKPQNSSSLLHQQHLSTTSSTTGSTTITSSNSWVSNGYHQQRSLNPSDVAWH